MFYFDCDSLLGRPKVPLPDISPCLNDLLGEMGRLGIGRALVRHRACLESTPEMGNALLMGEIAGREDLVPVWHLSPDGVEGEFDPAKAVERMLAAGVRVAWTTGTGRDAAPLLLDPWFAGPMLGALEAHRVPLLIPYREVPPTTLDSLLADFPSLPVILLEVPRWGRNALLYRLLERHRKLRLCVSALYSVHRGLEDLCEQFGPERVVFGSGYPRCEGGASLAAITYAEIGEEAREAIAGRNLEGILREVLA